MNDIKVIPQAGGNKDFLELFQEAFKLIRSEEKVIAVGYFVCTEEADYVDFTGQNRALKAAAFTLFSQVDARSDDDS